MTTERAQCEADYEKHYVYKNEPGGMSVDEYCDNRSGGPVDPYGLYD